MIERLVCARWLCVDSYFTTSVEPGGVRSCDIVVAHRMGYGLVSMNGTYSNPHPGVTVQF
eukprot:5435944-Amphidinium_carterae.2